MARVEMNTSTTQRRERSNRRPEHREKITKGKVTKKRPSYSKQFRDVFFGAEVADVKSYLFFDVLLPTIKDSIMNSMQLMFYGKVKSGSRTSYGQYYHDGRSDSKRKNEYLYDEICFNSRKEALAVLDELQDILDEYGDVTVADLYGLVGMDEDHTDRKYGWTQLRSADVISTRDGFLLDLPRPKPL